MSASTTKLALGVRPVDAPSAERNEPLDLRLLLLFAGHVQVQVSSVGLVQQQRRAIAPWRNERARVVAVARHIAEGAAPEGCGPADVGDVQHHGSDLRHGLSIAR